MEKRLNLRFNLDREADRRAWEYLCRQNCSKNKAIISAIIAHEDQQQRSKTEQAFLNRIIDTIRTELRSAPLFGLSQILQPQVIQQQEPELEDPESVDNLMDFLDSF